MITPPTRFARTHRSSPQRIRTIGRAAGAATALALVLSGGVAALSATVPAHAAVADSCTATMTPSSIRPGGAASFSVTTADDRLLPGIILVNGKVVPGQSAWWKTETSESFAYAWWASFADGTGITEVTSAGYRLYSRETGDNVTDSTDFLCEAEVTLLPVGLDQTITFSPTEEVALSVGTTTVSATASSGLDVSYESKTGSVCTVNTVTGDVTLLAGGECEIAANQAGDADYEAAPEVSTTFYVQVPQQITFAPVADQVLGAGPVQLDVSTSSGRQVSVTSSTPQVCSVEQRHLSSRTLQRADLVESPRVELLAVGRCTLTASRGGSGMWLAAAPVTRSFAIKAVSSPGVLTLTTPAGAALSSRSQTLRATSTASGPITVTSTTPAVCTVAGRTASLRKAGTCTVRATQAGAVAVTRSFPVWGAPKIAKKGKATTFVNVLGAGESHLRVRATPASVCRVNGARVLLIAGGDCAITVRDGKRLVRSATVAVAYPKASKPAGQLELAGTAYFAFDSATLNARAKKTLRGLVPSLTKAQLVVVYGNTYGPGKNSARSRELSAARAKAVAKFLAKRGVKAKAVKVAAAMENPVSAKAAKNRRADIYVVNRTTAS